MLIVAIQSVALLIQCASAVFAIRLIRVTNRYLPWLMITLSIMLIVPRRTIAFGRLVSDGLNIQPDISILTESCLLLAISMAQALGLLLIEPLFRSIIKAQDDLRLTNADIELQVIERTKELDEQRDQLLKTYEKLQKTEHLRDGLTDMIVHDLRTPLTSIYGFLETIKNSEGERLSEEGRNYLETVVESTHSLTAMVNSLLDVSKMESDKIELDLTEWDPIAATKKILEELEPLRGSRRISLLASEVPLTIKADANLIKRVITNLIGNALKFTMDNSLIQVGIELQTDKLRVFVRDNGPGIPAEHQDRIFEKFGQVDSSAQFRARSTGLGLTFCKLAVEAHNGRIWVESEVNKGSTFYFEIPSLASDIIT